MRTILCAIATFSVVTTAYAQETAPSVPAPEAPVADCGELPPDPPLANGATANMAAMGRASDAYQLWTEVARSVLECRRLKYNAVIERTNAVSRAYQAQLDAFCARRDIRCDRNLRSNPETPSN